jgi:hypothetical protein
MTEKREDSPRKNNLLDLESKLAKAKLSEGEKCSLSIFLKKTALLVNQDLQDYTGHVCLHIHEGELTSWKSKSGGRYKD